MPLDQMEGYSIATGSLTGAVYSIRQLRSAHFLTKAVKLRAVSRPSHQLVAWLMLDGAGHIWVLPLTCVRLHTPSHVHEGARKA